LPIKIPNGLPAVDILAEENIFVMTDTRAITQDIRPLKILVLNLMPKKIETETQLMRLLSNTPIQVDIELLNLVSHVSKNTPQEHLLSFYTSFDEIKDNKYDGMIITGAPVEQLEFEGFKADSSRIASNVVTGISFLGAGMIFVKGTNIKGLTTAAGIWSTAAVGLAIGCGLYITGIVSTLIIIIIQILFHTFLIGFDKILANDNSFDIVVRLENTNQSLERFKEVLAENNIVVRESKITLGDDNYFTIVMSIAGDAHIDAAKVLEMFNEQKEIKAITM